MPLVFRSYTNTQPRTEVGQPNPETGGFWPPLPNNGPFRFQFNHHLDVLGADVLEADGNRSTFRYSHDRFSVDGQQLWQVYVNDIGTYATMEMHYNYVAPPPPPPPDCPPCPGGDRKPSPTGATSTSPKSKSSAATNHSRSSASPEC